MKNIKKNTIEALLLLPVLWAFTGMFLYPNGKKAIVVLILIAVITSLLLYGLKNLIGNLKNYKILWLLGACSIFAIIADCYYGYSSSQLRAFISTFIYLAILPPSIAKKIDLKLLTIAGAITAVTYTSIQMYVYHTARMWSINPIPYATFIATIAILSFYYLLQSNTLKQRVLWVTIFTISLIPLFNSQSRGLWLALSITMLVMILKLLISQQKKVGVSAFLVGIISVFFMLQFDAVTQRIDRTKVEVQHIANGNFQTSIGLRLQLWHAASQLISDSPIIGLGDTHKQHKKELANKNVISKQIVNYTHYHNQFIDTLVKYGVAGLSLLLSAIFLPAYYLIKNDNKHKWPGLLVISIFSCAALTDVPFQHASTLTLYFLMAYITSHTPNIQTNDSSTEREI